MLSILRDIWQSTKTALIIAVLICSWLYTMDQSFGVDPREIRELTKREAAK